MDRDKSPSESRMNTPPASPPPPARAKASAGNAVGWFVTGFLSCGLLLIVGSFLFFYFKIKPSVDQAMKAVATTPPPIPRQAPRAVLEGQWTRADGSKLDLASLRGKVVVINVWATWCAPCMAELPSLARLAAHYGAADDVRVLCVSNEAPAVIWPKMNPHEAAPLLYSSYRRQLPALYETRSIPATFVINKRGNVVFQHVGAANWASDETFQYVDTLRREPSS